MTTVRYEKDFVFSPQHNLRPPGYPKKMDLSGLGRSTIRSLAGEAMHMTGIGSAIYSYYLNPKGLWWSRTQGRRFSGSSD